MALKYFLIPFHLPNNTKKGTDGKTCKVTKVEAFKAAVSRHEVGTLEF
jgi:hypothetical protein